MFKKISILGLILLPTFACFSQVNLSNLSEIVPGEIIVKFKDHVETGVQYGLNSQKGDLRSFNAQVSESIKSVLSIEKVKSVELLFSNSAVQTSLNLINKRKTDKFNNGPTMNRMVDPASDIMGKYSLKNIFKLKLSDSLTNIFQVIEQLKENPSVDFAEPNYIYKINDFKPEGEILYDIPTQKTTSIGNITLNDPFYPQQPQIAQTSIDKVWEKYTTGNGGQVVSILDTGVDIEHPDLKANIWINKKEKNGVTGFDDDGNGFIDDINGWDFINNDNLPMDDNMHGTHVAGIVGAVGNNGIGVAGAAWNVKLMPIKVFQSNGTGNSTDIAKGLEYATKNGASVQNMSFGSTGESMTLKAVLDVAYGSSILVAAAGNNKICIGPGICPDKTLSAPFYPAAYTFVLGVEDANGNYDNYDQDGPTFSRYANFLNYEIQSAGSSILSTVPNGGYQKLTGTSMAAPLLAGAMALYLEKKPSDSKELIFGNLINTSSGTFNLLNAIDIVPTPKLRISGAELKDNTAGQNANGFWEPNEVIDIFPIIKNYWGPSKEARVKIEWAEFEDQSKATILTKDISIGSLSAYATLKNLTNSLKVKLASNVANNVIIKFVMKVYSADNPSTILDQIPLEINVKNAVLLYGIINSDLTLTKDKEYLVTDNLFVSDGATLTINPGVVLKISDGKALRFAGSLIANGTKTENITFINENNFWSGFKLNPVREGVIFKLNYCNITGLNDQLISGNPTSFGKYEITNCKIYGNYFEVMTYMADKMQFSNNLITQNKIDWFTMNGYSGLISSYNNFIENSTTRNYLCMRLYEMVIGEYNNYFSNGLINKHSLEYFPNRQDYMMQASYFGSSKKSTVDKNIIDYFENNNLGVLDSKNYLLKPSPEAHGLVWKVLINGKDSQDEYELMDPIGVGTYKFDVYFNRAMDPTFKPVLSYGVGEPYTQKIITEDGTWNTDKTIYTVNHQIKIGASDGVNRIRVTGARDLDNFEIPVEQRRFNMNIQSVGSASTGFSSKSSLGQISLDWQAPPKESVSDVLGYNVYRHEVLSNGSNSDTLKLNTTLIKDVNYIDYNVKRDKKYFYNYKILRTNFQESSPSKTVSGQLLTARLGDSNGDFNVNALDVVNTVNYILGSNPTPFIDYASDVNNDLNVNVLDVVGIVNLILNPSSQSITENGSPINYFSKDPIGTIKSYWKGDSLKVFSEKPITGLQIEFDSTFNYKISKDFSDFEQLNYNIEGKQNVMLYNFKDLEKAPGEYTLLISKNHQDVTKGVGASTNARKLTLNYNKKDLRAVEPPLQTNRLEIVKVYPNPNEGMFKVHYYLPETVDHVTAEVYDLLGRLVYSNDQLTNTVGYSNFEISIQNIERGSYILVMKTFNQAGLNQINSAKIIKN